MVHPDLLSTPGVAHYPKTSPPTPEDRSDPGPFERRDDDTEEALRRHLREYHREIGPLKQHYERQGLLSVVNADRTAEEITAEILAALGNPDRRAYYTL